MRRILTEPSVKKGRAVGAAGNLAVRTPPKFVAQRPDICALRNHERLETSDSLSQILMLVSCTERRFRHPLDALVGLQDPFVSFSCPFVGADQRLGGVLDRLEHDAEVLIHELSLASSGQPVNRRNYCNVRARSRADLPAFVKAMAKDRPYDPYLFTPSYSSICVVRSIGYEIFTSVILPLASMTGSSFGCTNPL